LLIFFLLFVGVPLIELYVLIQVGAEIGALPTVGLSILTALIGATLARRQGFAVLARVHAAADRGEVPALPMLDGALLLIAGLMLLLPGFVTDVLGFLLLVPAIRRLVVGRFVRIIPQRPAPGQEPPRIIEGDFRRYDD
jgi:UPF0716 protein FxsA